MFGYVRIYKPELKICEYEAYKAAYCTICKRLGKLYGLPSRLLLNYDFTFVAMLGMALRGFPIDYRKGRCVCNPLKRCAFCTCESEPFNLTAAMTVEMFYYKLEDNRLDSGAFGKAGWSILKALAAPMRKRVMKRYPDLDPLVAECIRAQNEAESSADCSLDMAAEPSARLISSLAELLSDDPTDKVVLRDFGYYLGRWIYLIDAFDDLADDCKKDGFNPFAAMFGLTAEDAKANDGEGSERLAEARSYANECLNMTVARAITSFELLDVGEYEPIFHNILYLGLGESQRRALHEKELQ